MYVCMFVCMYVCMYVYTYIRIYVCIYIRIYVHRQILRSTEFVHDRHQPLSIDDTGSAMTYGKVLEALHRV